MPERLQLRRVKGFRLPPDARSVAHPGRWGNPFRVGGYFMLGDPDPRARLRMEWCQSHRPDPRFTLITSAAMAVDWYRRLAAGWNPEFVARVRRELGGLHLACYCRPGDPCHADVLLEVANP